MASKLDVTIFIFALLCMINAQFIMGSGYSNPPPSPKSSPPPSTPKSPPPPSKSPPPPSTPKSPPPPLKSPPPPSPKYSPPSTPKSPPPPAPRKSPPPPSPKYSPPSTPKSPPPPRKSPPPPSPKYSPPPPTPKLPPPPPRSSNTSFGVGFYNGKCKINVEAKIKELISQFYNKDRTIPAALLRMMFHDCFVKGCDASLLLDDGSKNNEKDAPANGSVRGYELIEAIKKVLENSCPGLVSCADIIVAATRDAVVLAGGKYFQVELGRRDGPVSLKGNVNLPSPSLTGDQAVDVFKKKGISTTDCVLLLGGHTVGITHCSFVKDRLYNFSGTGKPDPSMDEDYREKLKRKCPQKSVNDNPIALDDGSQNTVDKNFFVELTKKKGALFVDQALYSSTKTKGIVASLASGKMDFQTSFNKALINLGRVEILTGSKGVIRKICSKAAAAK